MQHPNIRLLPVKALRNKDRRPVCGVPHTARICRTMNRPVGRGGDQTFGCCRYRHHVSGLDSAFVSDLPCRHFLDRKAGRVRVEAVAKSDAPNTSVSATALALTQFFGSCKKGISVN